MPALGCPKGKVSGQQTGYILWGAGDATHSIVGTAVNPEAHKVGNQVFALWLAQRLSPTDLDCFEGQIAELGR